MIQIQTGYKNYVIRENKGRETTTSLGPSRAASTFTILCNEQNPHSGRRSYSNRTVSSEVLVHLLEVLFLDSTAEESSDVQ